MYQAITRDGKAELIKRAVEHAEADRLIQAYGFFEAMTESEAEIYNRPDMNGEKTDWKVGEFAGCAVGCLATPVLTQDEYQQAVRDEKLPDYLSFDAAADTLEDQFGVPRELTSAAEVLFESLPKEDALEWPEQFARALPIDLDPDEFEEKVAAYVLNSDTWHHLQTCRQNPARFVTTDEQLTHTQRAARVARDDLLLWLNGDTEPASEHVLS